MLGNNLEVKHGIQGSGVFTKTKIFKGDLILKMTGTAIDKPTRTSVQIGENKHIEDKFGIYVNHSCDPNAIVIRETVSLVSIKEINPGDEITFNYNDNEDNLANSFVCRCCDKLIKGKYSPSENSQ